MEEVVVAVEESLPATDPVVFDDELVEVLGDKESWHIMTSSSASSVRSMKSPSAPALLTFAEDVVVDDAVVLVLFDLEVVNDDVVEGASFLAASWAKNEDAEEVDVLEDASLPAPKPDDLERFVNGEFLKMFGVEAREDDVGVDVVVVVAEEDDDNDDVAAAALLLLTVMPPFFARSRSTSDELVAAAFGATVDADRPSPYIERISSDFFFAFVCVFVSVCVFV